MMFSRQSSYTAAAATFLFSPPTKILFILPIVAIVNSFSFPHFYYSTIYNKQHAQQYIIKRPTIRGCSSSGAVTDVLISSFDVSNYHSLMYKSRFGSLRRPLSAVLPHGNGRAGCGGGGCGGRRSRLATPAAAFGSRSSSLVTSRLRRQYNSHEFHNRSGSSSCLSSTNKEDVQERIIHNDDDKTAAAAAAQQWLTYSLPEGYCVGVALLQQQQQQSTAEQHQQDPGGQHQQLEQQQQQEQSSLPLLPHGELLHSEEYNWGQTNMISSNSRTSYYLGRIALRLALKRLLLDDDDDDGDDELQHQQKKKSQQKPPQLQKQKKKSQQQKLNQKLWEEIITNPIQKDSFGRPILPELVVGSISHKGNYAVGLAAFHNQDECESEEDECEEEDDDYNEIIRWREDCPIYYNDDGSIITSSSSSTSSGSNSNSRDNNNDGSSNNNINQGRIGIGIDLERIDDTRGDRIQRKVLTKNEQSELGGLVDTCGISIGEEVTLRFSLKESVYKAMHPILCEYVGFQEAEITPLSNGSAKVILNLHSGSHERLGLVIRSISWRRLDDGFFLTTALVGCDGGVGVVDR